MCAAPAKTSDEEVIATARRLIARDGAPALSMPAVAAEVGVRAPSLYKRFTDRDALLDAVALRVLDELGAQLLKARSGRHGVEALDAMARAYRMFAKRSPHLYNLLYAKRSEDKALDVARVRVVEPVLHALGELDIEPGDRLPAGRLLTAFLHGFVSMEIEGAFHMGGDVARAFDYSLDKVLRSLSAPH